MALLHFLFCVILTFGPYPVIYVVSPLSKYKIIGTSIKAALACLVTALVKIVFYATFVTGNRVLSIGLWSLIIPTLGQERAMYNSLRRVSTSLNSLWYKNHQQPTRGFDLYFQELLKALICFIDVVGIYCALTQLTHGNIARIREFASVGLGWAFANSVLFKLIPLWESTNGPNFTLDSILLCIEAIANLVLSMALALLGSIMWFRKNNPTFLIPTIYFCTTISVTMPSIASFLRRGLGWHFPDVACFEFFISLAIGVMSVQLYNACKKLSSQMNRKGPLVVFETY